MQPWAAATTHCHPRPKKKKCAHTFIISCKFSFVFIFKAMSTITADIYAEFLQQDEHVMRDEVTMLSFKQAIAANAQLFAGATVLEINCGGNPLLALWSAQAGAARVLAVESRPVCRVARQLVQQNKLQHIIEVIEGELQQLTLPAVDIIVSKWMGACLMFNSTLEALLYARDKWLKTAGHIFPHSANLYMALAAEPRQVATNWSCYAASLNLSHALSVMRQTPRICCVDASQMLSKRQLLRRLDLHKLQRQQLSFNVPFKLRTLRQGIAKWFVLYFDFSFPGVQLKPLSTSPSAAPTQWQQTLLHIDEHLPLCQGDALCGQFKLQRGQRHLDFDIDWQFANQLLRIQRHKQIYRMQPQVKP
ncbi:protein arginine N-methyltransferase 1-B-like isoform X1 [Drosophila busckii]|uniref:protein arginine N-methyltransferase 1-B-like isoform X1 n=1 Tax=Drosophila busckii TaxID=30019 RepID=UPI00083F2738|nr:protein arginine N-methyltransferase 1-B-like isoform X1 [Drosophila busckii]